MVDVKELMINNYLMYEGKYVKVLAIDPLIQYINTDGNVTEGAIGINNPAFGMEGDILSKWTYKFDPIPLSPDILRKCGFKYSSFRKMWRNKEIIGIGVDLPEIISLDEKICDVYGQKEFICGINYLHQLQNLMTVLGHELKIDL